MPATELLIAFIAFVGVPGILLLAAFIIGRSMDPENEPLYRPQDWGCQDVDRRK